MKYGLGQIGWTVGEIVKQFPNLDPSANSGTFDNPNPLYQKLSALFYEKMSHAQISWFRKRWHDWRADKDEIARKEIVEFLVEELSVEELN